MPNLSIKNVPDEVVAGLRERATANHRSLQGELLALVSQAVSGAPGTAGAQPAANPEAPQGTRQGHKSIEQIAAEHRKDISRQKLQSPARKGPRTTTLIRQDRDAR